MQIADLDLCAHFANYFYMCVQIKSHQKQCTSIIVLLS